MDLEEKIVGTGHVGSRSSGDRLWRLTIFGSGKTELQALSGGMDSHNYDSKSFSCNKDVFKVKNFNYGGDTWEKPVADIKLTLAQECKEEEGKKVCDIKIVDGAGLEWNPNFNPKVILLS